MRITAYRYGDDFCDFEWQIVGDNADEIAAAAIGQLVMQLYPCTIEMDDRDCDLNIESYIDLRPRFNSDRQCWIFITESEGWY